MDGHQERLVFSQYLIFDGVVRLNTVLEVSARAESTADAANDNDAHIVVAFCLADRSHQVEPQLGLKRIHGLWAIQQNGGHAVAGIVDDLLEFHQL